MLTPARANETECRERVVGRGTMRVCSAIPNQDGVRLRSRYWLPKLVDMKKLAVQIKESKVGAFEAKTHLADLLRQVESGRSFEICRRGKPIARLIPSTPDGSSANPETMRAGFRAIRRRISGPVKVRLLIEAGRRR